MSLIQRAKAAGKAVAVLGTSLIAHAAFAVGTVPTVVQDQIDQSTLDMTATGQALLAVLVVVLSFKWLRRVMK